MSIHELGSVPEFKVYTGKSVQSIITSDRKAIIEAVEEAYRAHHAGLTENPDSYFLRFPDNAANRIIALPAHVRRHDDNAAITGIKWISSFPGNLERHIPRASAVLILNDEITGYPLACMEASIISAARTAASAASALRHLRSDDTGPLTIGIVGAGLISRYIVDFIHAADIAVDRFMVCDLNPEYAHNLAEYIRHTHGTTVQTASDHTTVMRQSEVIVFATTAPAPYVTEQELLAHKPLVLNISLRDIGPELILSSYNIVDDIDHCLKANTSPHLAEMRSGSRDFITNTLPAILSGAEKPARDKPIIFSPFGMGILDLALGALIHRQLSSEVASIEDFYFDLKRA